MQCFSHIYRRHTYDFVIVNKMKAIDDVINVFDNIEFLLDSILNFQVYKFLIEQIIKEFSQNCFNQSKRKAHDHCLYIKD